MWRVLVLAFLLARGLVPPAYAQVTKPVPTPPAQAVPKAENEAASEAEDDSETNAPASTSTLTIDFDRSGSAQLSLLSSQDLVQLDALHSFLTGPWGCRLEARELPWLSKALSGKHQAALEKTWEESSRRYLKAQCSGLMHRKRFISEGILDFQPLLQLLQANDAKTLEVSIHLPPASVQTIDADFANFKSVVSPPSDFPQARDSDLAKALLARPGYWLFNIAIDQNPGPIRIRFGYRDWDIYKPAIATGLYIIIPLVVLLGIRARALRRSQDDPAAAWFSYMRAFQFCVNATFLLWCGTRLNPQHQITDLFAFFGWQTGWKQVVSFVLVLMAPAWTVYVASTVLSYRVFTRLKNASWTRSDFLKEQFAALGKSFFPLGFFVAAAMTVGQNLRVALLLLLMAYLSAAICASLAARFAKSHPAAVTAGPLRDRIFEMANRMGVKLRQVFVVSATRTSTANAFATTKQTIIFTDYLISKLTQREVDSIAAHELTHLRFNHAQKSVMALWAAIFSPTLFGMVAGFAGGMVLGVLAIVSRSTKLAVGAARLDAILSSSWMSAVVLFAAFAGFYYLRRRFEYSADFGAAAFTGDPEGTITALLKVSRLGLLPLQWGRGSESMLTHPSTMRRVQRIADAHRISPERLQQIIQSVASAPALAPGGQVQVQPEDQAAHYAVSESTPGVVPLRKTAGRMRFTLWILILFHLLPPVALVFALERLPRLARWRTWIMLGGLALSLTLYNLVVRGVTCRGRRKYAAETRSAAQKQVGPFEPGQAVAVGFAPGPTPRYFVAGYNWDHGVLFFTPEKLVFAGAHVGFALNREQIRIIVQAAGGPGWMKAPRVYFAWLDKATGRFGTFSFALLDQDGWFTHPAQAHVLYKRINSWRNRSSGAGEFALATGLGPPDVGSVTSVSPKEINKFSKWISMSILIVALGWGLATVLALPEGWYICLTALVLRIYEAIPYWCYSVRAYVSDPVVAAPLAAAPPPPPPPPPAEPVLVS